ncbi:hypothetical protein I4U23_025602 [Adineta vaga]|nr:hypothetical protein I4U23_025602 [Adineta vaga]
MGCRCCCCKKPAPQSSSMMVSDEASHLYRLNRENASLEKNAFTRLDAKRPDSHPINRQKSSESSSKNVLIPLIGSIDQLAENFTEHRLQPRNLSNHNQSQDIYFERKIQKAPPIRPHKNNISVLTNNPEELMVGYRNEPLTSLEDAMKPFSNDIDQLSRYIKEAKTKCHYPNDSHLTRDESAAIYLYTMQWESGSLDSRLQAAFSSGDKSKLKQWFKYLNLLKTAFDKLPEADSQKLWQVIPCDDDVKKSLLSNSELQYTSLGTWIVSDTELKKYKTQHANEQLLSTCLSGVQGKLISAYSSDKSKEIMLWPGSKLIQADYPHTDSNGSLIIHLRKKSDPVGRLETPSHAKHFLPYVP